MNLIWAIVAYLGISLVLGLGILQTVRGDPILLILGLVAYAVAFAKFGCLPRKPTGG